MNLVKTPIKEKRLVDAYEIHFSYEHGDADSTTKDILTVKNKTNAEMIEFFTRFNEVAEAIEQNRTYGVELPEYFKQMPIKVSEGLYVEPEYDAYAKMNMSNYYAEVGIEKVYYYDQDGNKFEVTGYE